MYFSNFNDCLFDTSISFLKSWRAFSAFLHNVSAGPRRGGGGGGGGAGWHMFPRRDRECPKFFLRIIGMVWWKFGMFWGVSMDRTTVMLTDK